MEIQELEQLVTDYQRLFHKVLRRCSIFPGQNDYEDYLQELRLRFYLKAEPYISRGHFEAENQVYYLFNYLLWYLVDQKRKMTFEYQEIQDEVLLMLQGEEEGFETIESLEDLEGFYGRLKPKDQLKVVALLSDEDLSRQSRSNYRKYFRKHFDLFFKKR